MSRTADYTIMGFLYQFNKSALAILDAEDNARVIIEGVIEDIEVVTPTTTTGIQCKYHEGSSGFTPSAIYKPLLQMLGHFANHTDEEVEYVLFAHFPGADVAPPSIGRAECEAALASKDKTLARYIETIAAGIDIDEFLKKFKIEFGPSYDEIVVQVSSSLEDTGFPAGEIDTLAYPNAIHIIAGLSILHDPAERQISRRQFLDRLNSIRTTAISRWTMALTTRKKLLEARRKQLKVHLDKNSRLRYFVINPKSFDDYEAEIVLFMNDYLDKYHFKPAHVSTPVICICASREEIQDIQHRLYLKGITATDGYIGTHFEESYFFRDPFSAKGAGGCFQREFTLRIIDWTDHGDVLNNRKSDDLFILGDVDCKGLNTVDVNVEYLAGTTIKEIKFLMGVSNVYE